MNFNSWIFKLPLIRNYDAITLPWGVYFKEEREQVDPVLLNHERVHVDQIVRVGIIRFYSQYVYEYFVNFIKFKNHEEAYKNISFEVEAYLKQWQ